MAKHLYLTEWSDTLMLGTFVYQFSWGMCVLAAFVGWGRITHRLLASDLIEKPDWGICAGWGMAFTVLVGGILSLLSWVSAPFIIVYVLAGAGYAIAGFLMDRHGIRTLSKHQILIAACIAIPLLSHFAAVVHMQANSCADDAIAYFPFVTRLLDTGTLLDPYSLRRLAAYGGHTFLQALVGATGGEDNAYLMDRGIAFLMAFALVLGYFRDRAAPDIGYRLSPLHGVILTIIIFAVPMPLLNSASHLTGLVIFLTLFRTLDALPYCNVSATRAFWLIGVIVAAAAALRIHFLFAAAFSVAFYWFLTWTENRTDPVGQIRALIFTGLSSLICLLPWMILLYRSSGTMLYPLFPGNHRQNFEAYAADVATTERLQFVLDVFSEPRLWFLLVPLALFMIYRHNRASFALSCAALLTTLVVTIMFTLSDVDNIHRYGAPIINAAIIATLMSFVRWAQSGNRNLRTVEISSGGARAVVAAFLLMLIPLKTGYDLYRVHGYWSVTALSAHRLGVYERLQDSVPADEAFFAVVSDPFAWDYGRNPIASVDIPGAASPDPGVPYFDGSSALRTYLQNQSLDYIIFGDFDERGTCLYYRRQWQFNLRHGVQIWKQGAPFYLDLMDNLEALANDYPVIFAKDGYRVVDIR